MPELLSVLWSLHVSSLEFSGGPLFKIVLISCHLHQGPQPYAQYQSWTSLRFEAWYMFLFWAESALDGISYAAYGIGSQTTWKPEDWFATLVLALTILGAFQWTDSIHLSINPGVLMNMRRLESEVIIRKEHENAIKINTRCCFIGFYCT